MTRHVTHNPSMPCTITPEIAIEAPCPVPPAPPPPEVHQALHHSLSDSLETRVFQAGHWAIRQMLPQKNRILEDIRILTGSVYNNRVMEREPFQGLGGLQAKVRNRFRVLSEKELLWMLKNLRERDCHCLVDTLDSDQLLTITENLLPRLVPSGPFAEFQSCLAKAFSSGEDELHLVRHFVVALESRFAKEQMEEYDAIHEALEKVKQIHAPEAYYALIDRLSQKSITLHLPLLTYEWLMLFETHYLPAMRSPKDVMAITRNLTPRQRRYFRQENRRLNTFTAKDVIASIQSKPLHMAVMAEEDRVFESGLFENIIADQYYQTTSTLTTRQIESLLYLLAPQKFHQKDLDSQIHVQKYLLILLLVGGKTLHMHECLPYGQLNLLMTRAIGEDELAQNAKVASLVAEVEAFRDAPDQDTLDQLRHWLNILKTQTQKAVALIAGRKRLPLEKQDDLLERIYSQTLHDDQEKLDFLQELHLLVCVRLLRYFTALQNHPHCPPGIRPKLDHQTFLCEDVRSFYKKQYEYLTQLEDELIVLTTRNKLKWK